MPEQTVDNPQATPGAASRSVADIVEMASLRWQLAELELHSDLAAARRLGLLGGAGVVAAIAAVAVLTVVLAGQLDAGLNSDFPWVTLSVGCSMLAGGLLAAWWGWRRFRGEFHGLRESIDECREDLVWLREWAEDRS
ncbi:MAG: phage holin family protein [Pirellulaceae bacterium]|jgi:uncharacterized membrane protein YqjE|nr:phage holin family protein [Pirellulaceae bacterium]